MSGDPLQGQREKVNSGAKTRLVWEDAGDPCPVKTGEVYELRSCSIEITKTHRSQTEGKVRWEAEFTRYNRGGDRVHILGASSGYTSSPMGAMKAQDDPDAATLVRLDSPNLGPEPEPEAVPPHEIGTYKGDAESQQRYLLAIAEARAAHEALPIEQRLASVKRAAEERHIDISSEERVIRQRLAKIEQKVFDEEAGVNPSVPSVDAGTIHPEPARAPFTASGGVDRYPHP